MDQISELVDKLPDPDQRGLMSNIDKEVVDSVTLKILDGGPDAVRGVIVMLKEPGNGEDYKAHYLLHCIAIHVGKDREDLRKMVSTTIAEELGKDHPEGVKQYLIQELQVVGSEEAVEPLGKFLLDRQLCETTAQALTAIRHGALKQFKKALKTADEKCKPTILQNIGILEKNS